MNSLTAGEAAGADGTMRRPVRHEHSRLEVLQRDAYACVICGSRTHDVHPIFDDALWDEGGDFAENGVALCAEHRIDALTTSLSVETLLDRAGLAERPLPPQLHAVEKYDRWGNPLLADGRRARGELFFQPMVQQWLERGRALPMFTAWVKYPRTYVLPWSDTIGEGDLWLASLEPLSRDKVVVTEKMDGENVSLYRDFLHTRSVQRIAHPSREWLNHFWEGVREKIPDDWRICGEYLYASHTVSYDSLSSYFLAFSVWNERNICLSWDDTLAFLAELGIEPVPVLYAGPLEQDAIHQAWREKQGQSEGYIVRSVGEIPYRRFRHLVGKYIRESYVQSEPVKDNMRTGAAIRKNALG